MVVDKERRPSSGFQVRGGPVDGGGGGMVFTPPTGTMWELDLSNALRTGGFTATVIFRINTK